MTLSLVRHPDSPCAAVREINADVAWAAPHVLRLSYTIVGAIGDLKVAAPCAPDRRDELWKTTCFEAFMRDFRGTAYQEFNFAPSSQWAAYGFSAYREGMHDLQMERAPAMTRTQTDSMLHLVVEAPAPWITRGSGPWRLALTTVIEEVSGAKSYWSLQHPPGAPEFHHADGFAHPLELWGGA